MADQTSCNVVVAIHRETVTGTAATATGADQMRFIDSAGLVYKQAPIQSQEKRSDGTRQMGRLGGKSVDGSINAELTVGGATDSLIEAIMRSTFTAAVAITESAMTSITTTTSTIIAAGGSWITEGVRVGDVVRLTDHAEAGNNNINLRVVTVTATTITVAGTPLTADAVADSAFTLTILKKVVTNTSAPTRYSYSVEQRDVDIDESELFLGCRLVGMRLSFQPNQMAQVTYTWLGMNRETKGTGESPYFTTPSVTTGLSLVADDAAIYYNGAAVTNLTGFDINFQIDAAGNPVIGSTISPDVYDNDLSAPSTITGIRQDLTNLALFDAETEFAVGILLEEPGTAPVGTLSFWLPRVKIGALSAPVGGGDGAKIETLELMVATADATTTQDATIANICSSAA